MPTPAATSDVTIFNSHDPLDYKHCRCGLYWDVCLLGQWPSKDRITLWHKALNRPCRRASWSRSTWKRTRHVYLSSSSFGPTTDIRQRTSTDKQV
jgi:hypothetical protein